ncbi:hypothetical protein YC2023_002251 [Brassica napus]
MQVNIQVSSNILDCSDRNNSKYYVYSARFNADDAVKNFLYSLNEGKIPKKRFNRHYREFSLYHTCAYQAFPRHACPNCHRGPEGLTASFFWVVSFKSVMEV